jgi:hypothetical protein
MARVRFDADDEAWEQAGRVAEQSLDAVTCPTGKVVIRRRPAAANIARVMRGRYGDPTITHYHCPECGHFHTGHEPGARRQKQDMAAMAKAIGAK